MQFSNYSSIDDLTKEAQAEVLLSSIFVDGRGNAKVLPVKCPGIGRKKDILMDNDKPACSFNKKTCPYFDYAEFAFEDYTKKVMCKVM